MRTRPALLAASILLALAAQAGEPIRLDLDATGAPRHILHARLSIPAKPGPLSLLYPKWIPGEHMPSGPLQDLVGLHFKANGKELAWRRDDVEMFEFHLTVPAGASTVDVDLDFLTPSGGAFSGGPSATPDLALLSWNTVMLYPKGQASDALQVEAKATLPAGWAFGTALPVASKSGNTVTFQPASLTTLVDSPVLTGRHFKRIDLGEDLGRPHALDIAADSDSALAITPETVQHFRNLVKESGALFGARHYRHYDFLLTLSDSTAHFGLEHHESSDDRVGERTLVDPNLLKASSGLLPHEMVHSWNGKFRRPAGLATGNYETPMKDELLWVYEGLTQYLGFVLTARSGEWTAQDARDDLAMVAAYLDHRPGREWRPLEDTAVEAQFLYTAPGAWSSWRRGVDFYDEGLLIWLDADTLIREKTDGKKSLDDFCHLFHGAPSGDPMVKPYGFDDVVKTLNQVLPYDWAGFLRQRVMEVRPHAPLDGVARSGWKVVFTEEPSGLAQAQEAAEGGSSFSHSLGFVLNKEGVVGDVIPGSPAFQAGLIPGAKLLAVDGSMFSVQALRDALKAGKTSREPLQLTVKDANTVRILAVDYHGGERHPHLERVPGAPDRLSEIFAAKAR
ncbi:MAG TPA: PDZ domain-containing protein [Holophagaceae bacterium]|nr:PDZ domain-containing protein [Holophagaceae bacterium]